MTAKDLLRSYLAWQGQVGTDEVILPHPMLRKQMTATPTPKPGLTPAKPADMPMDRDEGLETDSREPSSIPFQHAPAFQSNSPSNLFGDLSRALEAANKADKDEGLSAIKTLRATEALHFPVFPGLPEYWAYLEANARLLYGFDGDMRWVRGQGPSDAPLALVALAPGEADITAGKLFSGEAGALLEKMMRAIRLDCETLYRTAVVKCTQPGKSWSRRELMRVLPLLHIELGLAKVPVVLLMGETCAQAVLKTGKTLDELRQIPHREGGREFIVTYHPEDLLRREEWKRKAWEDLQWLQKRMSEARADR